MSRDYCSMARFEQGKCFCDYFDYGFAECREVKRCPEGLDDDDDGPGEDSQYIPGQGYFSY